MLHNYLIIIIQYTHIDLNKSRHIDLLFFPPFSSLLFPANLFTTLTDRIVPSVIILVRQLKKIIKIKTNYERSSF